MPQKSYTLAVLKIIIDTVLYICDTKGIIISSKDTRSSFWHFASHEYSSKVGIFISLYIPLHLLSCIHGGERERERVVRCKQRQQFEERELGGCVGYEIFVFLFFLSFVCE